MALSFASSPAAILADESITDPFHYSWRMIVLRAVRVTVMLLARRCCRPAGCAGSPCWPCSAPSWSWLLLPFIGDEVKGAARWINLGPFSLQPSEFAKPGLIVFAAWMFAEGQKGEGVPGVSHRLRRLGPDGRACC